jgi:hypothetical protein
MAGGLFANLSNNDGNTFGPTIDTKTDPCECCSSRVIFSANDSLVVLYRDKADGDRDTYVAVLGENEQSFSHALISQTTWPIDSSPMTGCFLVSASTGLIAGWETKGEIFFTSLDDPGKRRSDGAGRVGKGRYPFFLQAADPTKAVAWKAGTNLHWQLFDRHDKPIGKTETRLNVSSLRPAGFVTTDGNFILFP